MAQRRSAGATCMSARRLHRPPTLRIGAHAGQLLARCRFWWSFDRLMCTLRAHDGDACLVCVVLAAACGDDDTRPRSRAAPARSGTLAAGGSVDGHRRRRRPERRRDRRRRAHDAPGRRGLDRVRRRHRARRLHRARPRGRVRRRRHVVGSPVRADAAVQGRAPARPAATRRHVRIVAKRAGGTPFFPAVANRTLDDSDAYASRVDVPRRRAHDVSGRRGDRRRRSRAPSTFGVERDHRRVDGRQRGDGDRAAPPRSRSTRSPTSAASPARR